MSTGGNERHTEESGGDMRKGHIAHAEPAKKRGCSHGQWGDTEDFRGGVDPSSVRR